MEYVDEFLFMMTDKSETASSGTFRDFKDADSYYALTDRNYSVIAITSGWGQLQERVRYSAYGVARHSPAGDLDGDGDCDYPDLNRMLGVYGQDVTYGNPGYDVDDELDQDGEILFADYNLLLGNYAVNLPEARVSMQTIGNTVGYCGYLYDPAIDRYCVRFRWYDASTGRWLSRDPAGHVDGMNLYAYAVSSPIRFSDPSGLISGAGWGLSRAIAASRCKTEASVEKAYAALEAALSNVARLRGNIETLGVEIDLAELNLDTTPTALDVGANAMLDQVAKPLCPLPCESDAPK